MVPLPFWRRLRWQLTFALALLAVEVVLVVEAVTLSETSSQARRQVLDRLNYPDYPLTRACHSKGIDRALRQESGVRYALGRRHGGLARR